MDDDWQITYELETNCSDVRFILFFLTAVASIHQMEIVVVSTILKDDISKEKLTFKPQESIQNSQQSQQFWLENELQHQHTLLQLVISPHSISSAPFSNSNSPMFLFHKRFLSSSTTALSSVCCSYFYSLLYVNRCVRGLQLSFQCLYRRALTLQQTKQTWKMIIEALWKEDLLSQQEIQEFFNCENQATFLTKVTHTFNNLFDTI